MSGVNLSTWYANFRSSASILHLKGSKISSMLEKAPVVPIVVEVKLVTTTHTGVVDLCFLILKENRNTLRKISQTRIQNKNKLSLRKDLKRLHARSAILCLQDTRLFKEDLYSLNNAHTYSVGFGTSTADFQRELCTGRAPGEFAILCK